MWLARRPSRYFFSVFTWNLEKQLNFWTQPWLQYTVKTITQRKLSTSSFNSVDKCDVICEVDKKGMERRNFSSNDRREHVWVGMLIHGCRDFMPIGRLVSEWPSEACGVCCRTRRKGRRHYNRQQLWFSSVRLVLTEGTRATWDLLQLRKGESRYQQWFCM